MVMELEMVMGIMRDRMTMRFDSSFQAGPEMVYFCTTRSADQRRLGC